MTTDPSPSSNRCLRRRGVDWHIAAAVALLVTLAGCATAKHQDIVGSVPDDYRANHPIRIDEQLATMDIPVGLDSSRLTSPARGNITGFAQRFNSSGSALLAIVMPAGSPNEVAATGVSHQIYDVLVSAGVKPAAIDFRTYRAGPKETGAPIRLAYNRIAAHVEGCGAWPGRLEKNPHNRNFGNFGCATQSNLATMVDNPLDLLYPRALTTADAARRSAVLDGYRKGDAYSSRQGLEGGEVAQGVGN